MQLVVAHLVDAEGFPHVAVDRYWHGFLQSLRYRLLLLAHGVLLRPHAGCDDVITCFTSSPA
jgi:hypothetical protein